SHTETPIQRTESLCPGTSHRSRRERPYHQARMKSLWEADGRDDGGWIAPVLPRAGHRRGQKATARDAHAARHRARYFFNTNPNNIPMPAAIKTDCNGLGRMPSPSAVFTASP